MPLEKFYIINMLRMLFNYCLEMMPLSGFIDRVKVLLTKGVFGGYYQTNLRHISESHDYSYNKKNENKTNNIISIAYW